MPALMSGPRTTAIVACTIAVTASCRLHCGAPAMRIAAAIVDEATYHAVQQRLQRNKLDSRRRLSAEEAEQPDSVVLRRLSQNSGAVCVPATERFRSRRPPEAPSARA